MFWLFFESCVLFPGKMVVMECMRAREVLLAALNIDKDQEGDLTICAKAPLGIPQLESC